MELCFWIQRNHRKKNIIERDHWWVRMASPIDFVEPLSSVSWCFELKTSELLGKPKTWRITTFVNQTSASWRQTLPFDGCLEILFRETAMMGGEYMKWQTDKQTKQTKQIGFSCIPRTSKRRWIESWLKTNIISCSDRYLPRCVASKRSEKNAKYGCLKVYWRDVIVPTEEDVIAFGLPEAYTSVALTLHRTVKQRVQLGGESCITSSAFKKHNQHWNASTIGGFHYPKIEIRESVATQIG